MNFTVLTIFPELMCAFWENGIMRRAVESGIIAVDAVNIRDFAHGRHKVTDDRPYGGGCGMVMKPEPLSTAIQSSRHKYPDAPVILLSPQGPRFDQKMARHLAALPAVIFICGRYEGVDERINEASVDFELSLGDFVMTGGEIAAMAIMDAVTRLLPGALGNEDSADQDSFCSHRLDHAHYTRPPEFNGLTVPEVLLSGHHDQIAHWRRADALLRTFVKRPDLLRQGDISKEEMALLRTWHRELERIIHQSNSSGPDSSPRDE